jgi:hypothetical protein
MPEETAKQVGSMLGKATRPGVALTTHTLHDAHLPQLDVIHRTPGGIHFISPWQPNVRQIKELKHSLPTARSVTRNPDLNPAPSLATYRRRLQTMLQKVFDGGLPEDVSARGDNLANRAFIDPATNDALVQNRDTGQLLSFYRRTHPTQVSEAPAQFTHWWDNL